MIGLSHKVRNFNLLDIKAKGSNQEYNTIVSEVKERKLNKDIASTWKLQILCDKGKEKDVKVNISAPQQVEKDKNGKFIHFHSLEGIKIFLPVEFTVNLVDGVCFKDYKNMVPNDQERQLLENLTQIIKQEYDNIKELTEMEDGLRFALHRLLDLKQM